MLSGEVDCLVVSEVKAIVCDPFYKENGLKCIDSQKLIKPLFPQLRDSEFLNNQKDCIILEHSTYYYQFEANVKKIINKCRGNKLTPHNVFCMGVIFINKATSFEEFYSFLFHDQYGIYTKLLSSNVDVIAIVSFDAKNDFMFDNIYDSGYIQTLLIKPSERNKFICKILRMDNYISIGNKVDLEIHKKAQEEYGFYKVLCREGFVNIIPQDATENEINEYIKYLKSENLR